VRILHPYALKPRLAEIHQFPDRMIVEMLHTQILGARGPFGLTLGLV